MSKIRAEQYTDRAGTGAPSFPNGVEITVHYVVFGGRTASPIRESLRLEILKVR